MSVHPRSRGEYVLSLLLFIHIVGSSPLTRGIREPAGSIVCYRRFIPAHAGNTSHRVLLLSIFPVHPRSRGEYCVFHSLASDARGSSPLTRGIRPVWLRERSASRFIPAHAGNTLPAIFMLALNIFKLKKLTKHFWL